MMSVKNNFKKIILVFLFVVFGIANAGSTISFSYGSAYQFSSSISVSPSPYISNTVLTTSTFIAISSNSVWVGSIDSGGAISYGSAYTFSSDALAVFCDKVSDSSFIIVYSTSAANIYAIIGTVSGSTISFGTAFTVSTTSSNTSNIKVGKIDDAKFIITYVATSNTAKILTISGTTITGGTAKLLPASSGTSYFYSSISVMSTSQAIITYGGSGRLESTLVSISGTTITVVNRLTLLSSGTASYVTSVKISASSIVISYILSNQIHSTIITNSSDVLSSGSDYIYGTTLSTGSNLGERLTLLDSGTILITGVSSGVTSLRGFNLPLYISGSTLTYSSTVYIYYNITNSSSRCCSSVLTQDKVIVTFNAGSSYGGSIIGTISGLSLGKKINGITYSKWNNSIISKYNNF